MVFLSGSMYVEPRTSPRSNVTGAFVCACVVMVGVRGCARVFECVRWCARVCRGSVGARAWVGEGEGTGVRGGGRVGERVLEGARVWICSRGLAIE